MDEYKRYYYDRIGDELVILLLSVFLANFKVFCFVLLLPRVTMEIYHHESGFERNFPAKAFTGLSKTFTPNCLFPAMQWHLVR